MKRQLLDELVTGLRTDLDQLAPPDGSHPWLGAVLRFYGVGGRHVGT
ncbi:hypothetical protein JQX13_34450 [Archangium violaceum]|nr:hypothetical protein [Archangium violaceum]QRK05269.1 hypothetical protein JQX13_34450 [Archangium violaceum]